MSLKPKPATLTEPLHLSLASGARCINSRCSDSSTLHQKGQRAGESFERQVAPQATQQSLFETV